MVKQVFFVLSFCPDRNNFFNVKMRISTKHSCFYFQVRPLELVAQNYSGTKEGTKYCRGKKNMSTLQIKFLLLCFPNIDGERTPVPPMALSFKMFEDFEIPRNKKGSIFKFEFEA